MVKKGDKLNGYCFKCGEKKDFTVDDIISGNANFKNKKTTMAKGKCGTCGKTISRIVSSKQNE